MKKLIFTAMLVVAAPVEAAWYRAETAHFVIFSEDSQRGTEDFAKQLERFDNALRTLQGMPVVPARPLGLSQKVAIFRTGRASDIAALAGSPGSGIAGFYIARAGGSVAFTPAKEDKRDMKSLYERDRHPAEKLDPRSVLQHEYVHHFMLQNFPATYPDWYVEAFAELNATIELKPDGGFHVGNPPQYRAAQIYQAPDIPLNELFDQNSKRDQIDRIQFYGYGWLLAHYLSFSPSRKGQLNTYLKRLGTGEDGLKAARAAFGDLRALEREVRDYKAVAATGKFPGFEVKPNNYVTPNVTVRPLDAAEQAIIGSYMRSRRGVDRKTAPDVANDAVSVASRFPNSAFVQVAAAEANLDDKRYAAALAAADRALALDPNSTEAMVLKGKTLVEMGKHGDKARFAESRDTLRRAARLDPQDPRPLILYYQSFHDAGVPIPQDAILGLENAFRTAGSDPEYRLIMARQLLDEGKGDFAKTVLAPIAYRFHGDQKDNKVRPVLDLINANKVSEAAAKLRQVMKEAEEKAKKD